ncbi:MAG: hypothetical protein IPM21_09285 [Acidobacteria bacterium]|nr:hypothetical protein [Acidobacteriota bacterium]
MKYPVFWSVFLVVLSLFVAANAIDFFSERDRYYAYLEEQRMVWAGAWSWGFPFPTAMEGVGPPENIHRMIMPGAGLNLIIALAVSGMLGVAAESAFYKLKDGLNS